MAQLVGRLCAICHERIGAEIDGRFCAMCQSTVHDSCAAQRVQVVDGACNTCGVIAVAPEPQKLNEAVGRKLTSQEKLKERKRRLAWWLIPFLVLYGLIRIVIGMNMEGQRRFGEVGTGFLFILSSVPIALVLSLTRK